MWLSRREASKWQGKHSAGSNFSYLYHVVGSWDTAGFEGFRGSCPGRVTRHCWLHHGTHFTPAVPRGVHVPWCTGVQVYTRGHLYTYLHRLYWYLQQPPRVAHYLCVYNDSEHVGTHTYQLKMTWKKTLSGTLKYYNIKILSRTFGNNDDGAL